MKVGFVGLGKLGMPVAEVMATQHEVFGYDISPRSSDSVKVCSSLKDAVNGMDLVFIAVETPHSPEYGGETPTSHLPTKDFDYSLAQEVLGQVNEFATKDQLVVLISTVLPGTTRNHLVEHISNARFIYNPYLIAMNTVKWDFVNPEMVIIGTENGDITGDAALLIEFYETLMEKKTRYEVGTWDEAECIKIFYNTFISAKLGLVNMIQDVSEKNGNINVDVVSNAIAKSTERIMGPAYMRAGMGDGGPCHPRDNIALSWLSERLNLEYDLFGAIMHSREKQAEHMAKAVLELGRKIVIVGKAYKPGVELTNGSYSLLVGHYIEQLGGELAFYDPNTGDKEWPEWKDEAVFLIGYIDRWVKDLKWPSGATIFDPWRSYTPKQEDVNLVSYGNTRIHKNVPQAYTGKESLNPSLKS